VRKKWIITTTAAGAVMLGGVAVAAPAFAEDPTGTSAIERITEALAGLVDDGSLTQDQADEVAATLAESGLGGPGGRGGHGPGMDLSVAAETLGLSEEDLRTALEADGATLAQVAEDQGVEVDALVDALVAAGEERIADAVADGRITQEEADERLADLEARITERVESSMPERPGRPDGEPPAESD
jgi:polyhydroxyalkanoate synthesis regulator phasin